MSQLLEEYLETGKLKPRGVLHLGAEHCQESSLYDQAGATYVVWAEASPENWDHPETRKNLVGRPWQVMARKAVWSEGGLKLPFNIYNARSANSLFTNERMADWYTLHRPVATVDVETVTVDGLLAEMWPDPPHPDLLVMDLQGAELHALMGARGFLSNPCLRSIVTEAMTEPLYKGGCLLPDLVAYLAPYGFTVRDQRRHTVGCQYVDTVGVEIAAGRLAPVPQFDVLFQRD